MDKLTGKSWNNDSFPLAVPLSEDGRKRRYLGKSLIVVFKPVNVYVSTVPVYTANAYRRLTNFFDYTIFTNHCLLPTQPFDPCQVATVADLTILLYDLIRENG